MKAGIPGNNNNIMKKIFVYFFVLILTASCYDDYVKDFDYDAIYFPYQTNVRTFVVGEGMKIDVGVVLGGVKDNTKEREVVYQLDQSLINDEILESMKSSSFAYIKNAVSSLSELKILPDNYYTLSNYNQFVIEKGEHAGVISIKADSVNFLADASTLTSIYALPFRITKADADSVLTEKNYAVIGLKYENMLFGNYWHGGITVEKDVSGSVVSTSNYFTTIPSPESKIWELKTVAAHSLVTNGVSDDVSSSSKPEFRITLNGEDIQIESVEGATYEVLPDGKSSYNRAKLLQNRKIFLSYKYQNKNGNWCYAQDTLTFRNRIRDGVNEWQDENPDNYK